MASADAGLHASLQLGVRAARVRDLSHDVDPRKELRHHQTGTCEGLSQILKVLEIPGLVVLYRLSLL